MTSELEKYIIDKELQHTDNFIFCVAPFFMLCLTQIRNKLFHDPNYKLVTLITICKLRTVLRYQREVIRIRKLKKDIQRNGQKKKKTSNDLQNIHITKDRVTQTPLYPHIF